MVLQQEEEMKGLSLSREKFIRERAMITRQLEELERENKLLTEQHKYQQRLIVNVTGHKNNQAALLNDASVAAAEGLTVQEKVAEEAARNERIAKQVSRTVFMGLGENPPKLVCENSHPLLMSNS